MNLVILDRWSHWLQAYASKTKNHIDTAIGFQRFLGPKVHPAHVYTDNSKEFETCFRQLQYSCDTSTPYRPETNGVAERAVRKVKEGTSCALVQSGFSVEWWVEAQSCFAFLYNVSEILPDGYTPFEKRFSHKFNGPIISFGAEVNFKPSSPKDKENLHTFGPKTLSGIFIGYSQEAGGSWNGDLLIAEWFAIENAERAGAIHVQRIKAKEVVVMKLDGKFRFPLQAGDLRQPATTLERINHPSRPVKWRERLRRATPKPPPEEDEIAPPNLVTSDSEPDEPDPIPRHNSAGGDSCDESEGI